MKASILIANYNNAQFIKQCINSLISQTYKNIEIIFFDDASYDNSLDEIKKFNNIKLIVNKNEKKEYGSYNQINSYKQALKYCTGDIIFFLDSDDYFKINKVEEIIYKFKSDNKLKVLFDLPTFTFKNRKKIKRNNFSFLNNYWPFIPPQSCITISRQYINEVFDMIDFDEFPEIWMDFRIGIVSKYIFKELNILDQSFTCYRQSELNISSNYRFLTKNWWRRRLEAHKFVIYFFNKYKITHSKNIDYFITKIVNNIYVS